MNSKPRILFVIYSVLVLNIVGMAQIRKPGVFVKEISKFPPAVAEVETAIPAFIGYTEKAISKKGDNLHSVATKISSLPEYEQLFGRSSGLASFVLHPSIQLFFSNGGRSCYIVSVGGYTDNLQSSNFITGLNVISQQDEPTLLVFPDAVNLPGKELYNVQKAALKQAAMLGDRFCILDIKYADNASTHTTVVDEFRNNIGIDHLKFGAAYTPHVQVTGNGTLVLPPSAAVAAQYCSVDKERGVWKAPANVSLNMVTDLAYSIANNEQEGLNVDAGAGKSINAIRKFTGKGFLIWGARTLAGNDNEWRYVSVRRFFNMVEESVKKASLAYVFEPNDANTWIRIKGMVENYLTNKWRDGALMGAKPSEAFFVKIGLGQTMTQQDIVEGRLIIEIGMAVIKPAEFIILRVSQKMGAGR